MQIAKRDADEIEIDNDVKKAKKEETLVLQEVLQRYTDSHLEVCKCFANIFLRLEKLEGNKNL